MGFVGPWSRARAEMVNSRRADGVGRGWCRWRPCLESDGALPPGVFGGSLQHGVLKRRKVAGYEMPGARDVRGKRFGIGAPSVPGLFDVLGAIGRENRRGRGCELGPGRVG